jgi:hypothetical protein
MSLSTHNIMKNRGKLWPFLSLKSILVCIPHLFRLCCLLFLLYLLVEVAYADFPTTSYDLPDVQSIIIIMQAHICFQSDLFYFITTN